MGWPMAANVARGGFPLFVHNRTRERADAFARAIGEATVCASPAEVAAATDVVLTMLADGPAVDEVFRGETGLLASARPGTVLVEMSTIGPDHAASLGERVRAAGIELVDAPVSGSVATATSARLLVMAGGSDAAIARVRPVLEAIGSVVHVGPPGSGATMKLAVNAVVYGLNQSVSEALVLAERAGLDRQLTYEVFASSAVAAPFVHYRRDAFERPGEVPVAFRLELASRDLRLILALGEKVGADLRQSETNLAVLEQAAVAGFGDRDVSAVASFLRDKDRAPPAGIPERGG
jgi:3-hydroxyisobutyrate dehydrogenase/2-hydroxy-3-oxopropionate reductase